MKNKEFAFGKLKEKDFAKMFSNVTPSTTSEDMFQHWDVSVGFKLDIKSIKKESRTDIFYSENFHWVELQNVRGDKGWVDGEADYIVFEIIDYWIVVKRKKLKKFVNKKTNGKEVGSTVKHKDPYELYQRKGREDIITKVKTIDLMHLAHQIIKKDEENSN